jgi:hypothetical protein
MKTGIANGIYTGINDGIEQGAYTGIDTGLANGVYNENILQNAIVTNGLLLYLDSSQNLSYPRSGTVWRDLTTNNNNGTLTNGPAFNSRNGGSLVFDGSNDYVATNYTPTIGNSNITYSVWFKTSTLQTGGLIGVRQSPITIQVVLVVCSPVGTVGGNLFMASFDGVTNRTGSTTETYVDDKWYNAVMIHTSTSDTLYVNGILTKINLSVGQNIISTTNLLIGCNPNNNIPLSGWVFNGNISNSLVYNRALTAAEVLQNYIATKSRFNL